MVMGQGLATLTILVAGVGLAWRGGYSVQPSWGCGCGSASGGCGGYGRWQSGPSRTWKRSGDPVVSVGISIAELKLDADGQFRCDEIPPGGGYRVGADNQ